MSSCGTTLGQLRPAGGAASDSCAGGYSRRLCNLCTAAFRYRALCRGAYRPRRYACDHNVSIRSFGRALRTGTGTYVCADMMLRYAMLAPSIMSISPPSGQFGPYSQTADQKCVSTSGPQPSRRPSRVLHLHAGHVPQTEPGMWAKSPMTSPWFTGCLLSIRMLGRPPKEPSGSYVLVLSTLSLTVFVVVLTVA